MKAGCDTPIVGSSSVRTGIKDDIGKVKAALVLGDFAGALMSISAVGTFGANKYSEHGWLTVQNAINRYEDAMLRHWLLHKQGQIYDAESGLPHLAHFAWNALAILELQDRSTNKVHNYTKSMYKK